jgi:phosphatidylglycerophosphate synthase
MVGGAVLLYFAFVTDCVDGQLARYTGRSSPVGAWLDGIADRGKEYLVYLGLAIGAERGFGQHVWTLAVAAFALQVVRQSADFAWKTSLPVTRPGPPARLSVGYWLRRIAPLTIGDRFALIAVTGVFASPRTVLVVVVAWSLLGMVYAWLGKIRRAAAPGFWRCDPDVITALRDDGAAAARLAPARPRRLGWLEPPVVRLVELGALVAVAGVTGSGPAADGYLAALALHLYDTAYRLETARPVPARRLVAATGGWEVRTVLLITAAVLGVASPYLAAAAVLLGGVFLTEALAALRGVARAAA